VAAVGFDGELVVPVKTRRSVCCQIAGSLSTQQVYAVRLHATHAALSCGWQSPWRSCRWPRARTPLWIDRHRQTLRACTGCQPLVSIQPADAEAT